MENQDPFSGFDEEEELEQGPSEADERLHRLFKQNPEGAMVLAAWNRRAQAPRGLQQDLTPYRSGWLDGENYFAQVINIAIARVEKDG